MRTRKHRAYSTITIITKSFLPYQSAKGGNTRHELRYPRKKSDPNIPISKELPQCKSSEMIQFRKLYQLVQSIQSLRFPLISIEQNSCLLHILQPSLNFIALLSILEFQSVESIYESLPNQTSEVRFYIGSLRSNKFNGHL